MLPAGPVVQRRRRVTSDHWQIAGVGELRTRHNFLDALREGGVKLRLRGVSTKSERRREKRKEDGAAGESQVHGAVLKRFKIYCANTFAFESN